MNRFANIIIAIILAAVLLIIVVMSLLRIDRFLDIQAVEVCSNSSSFIKQNSDEDFTAKYPIEDLYKNCIESTK